MTLDEVLDRTGYEGGRDDVRAIVSHLLAVPEEHKAIAADALERIAGYKLRGEGVTN